ncbi:MAG: anaerobic ribonucleoside-triphosphate reductase activating protein [Planctomycetota bacterium]|jgi:pyruvate formate lyase activating enzyme|nr:anaerobic ribonucleoside-triphosphate reductase activating protein [Planctomycetota bacterium]
MADGNAGFDLRGLIANSLLEWEDHVAAVAVAGGCNLRCPFCHSWRYVTGLADLRPLDAEELFRLLERQSGWIDGVVFTGGEPTLQPGLAGMMRRARALGARIKLHTNGSRPGVVRKLLREGLLDLLALDYKAPLDGRLAAATGLEDGGALAAAVRETFVLAAGAGVEREYHTTLVPGFVDEEAFAEMAERLDRGGLWILQQFENGDCLDRRFSGSPRYGGEALERLAARARAEGIRVLLRKGKSA